jgi:hypothetical protein
MPESACDAVFASSGYSKSVQNFAQVTLTTDNVFRDSYSLQVASVTGSVSEGYVASLVVGVAV